MKRFNYLNCFQGCLFLIALCPTSTVISQNVGVGTATPLEKLHVIGNIRSSTLSGAGSRLVLADPNGTLSVGTGLASPAWMTSGNSGLDGGTTTTAGGNFLGTTDAQNVCFRTNNVERGRFSALGEFFVGTLNTVITGDLMNSVGNTMFPWAVNGYVPAGANGGGIYGQVQAGNTTIYGAVQGEYSGTNASGAGVRGIAITPAAIGVQGQEPTLLGWAGLFNGDIGAVLPGGFWTVSDQKLKTNIHTVTNTLEKIKKINAYTYDSNEQDYPDFINGSRRTIGFLAQEVEAVFPEAVTEKNIPSLHNKRSDTNSISGTTLKAKAVSYDSLIPILLEAIKEQQELIEKLNARITALETK